MREAESLTETVELGHRTLDVGCGRAKLPGAVGIDIADGVDADIIHDLTVFPWPVADNSFDTVRLWTVLEHLPNTVRTMTEVHQSPVPGQPS